MSLIAETSNPLLEQALLAKLHHPGSAGGTVGDLEPVAVRLGLVQNSMRPRFREPQLVLFAADHGLAVEGIETVQQQPTDALVADVLAGRHAVAPFARHAGLHLTVVDCGMAGPLPQHERLLSRKIAHGTRNARLGQAMTVENAHAAIRAGMEIGNALPGNMVACAGLGVGSHEAAALVLARLTQSAARDLLISGPDMNPEALAHLQLVAQAAMGRHRDVADPVEVLAAFGGFETAMMVGMMLVAASKRHLIIVDGITACAALMAAARISPPVTDYCVFCRSRTHQGLDEALALFQASSMLDLGLDTTEGAGACLAWPLVQAAASLVADGTGPDEAIPASLLPDADGVPPFRGDATTSPQRLA